MGADIRVKPTAVGVYENAANFEAKIDAGGEFCKRILLPTLP
jgi:hypothetical protein